jgi:hypothetical protein
MIKEWPCTCLPAPFDDPCEGCKRNELARLAEALTPDAAGNLSLTGDVTIDPADAGSYVVCDTSDAFHNSHLQRGSTSRDIIP